MIDNPRIASAVLRHCSAEGVREYCLAAGARNAPLALALLKEGGRAKKVYHFFDERAAGFFALGRCLATRRPVAVVTTSGTAVAELLPAMVEAHYQGIPLVAVTADRPVSYRGSGAPQAIEQQGIFGVYAEFVDVGEECSFPPFRDSPIHLNVPFDEPTSEVEIGERPFESGEAEWKANRRGLQVAERTLLEEFLKGGRAVGVVGSLHPEEADSVGAFFQRLGIPVYAEPASNLKGSPQIGGVEWNAGAREWVALMGQADRILRIGGVPVARWWRDLENSDHKILNLSPSGHSGISRKCASVRVGDFSALDKVKIPAVSGIGIGAELLESGGQHETLFENFPRSEPSMIRALSALVRSGAAVYLGNSLPVRDWDLAAVSPAPGTVFFANRGANGIDGALSTALGAGADFETMWAVVGDLTALYDLSAPWVIPQIERRPKIRIAVINNGGGRIFSHLPALAEIGDEAEEAIQNRHAMEFGDWASMWGLDHIRIESPAGLSALVPTEIPDQVVIEIVPDADETTEFWKRFRER